MIITEWWPIGIQFGCCGVSEDLCHRMPVLGQIQN